jgi:hypothetical protein
MPDYPIIYDPSFVFFWGVVLAFSLYTGGLLAFATVCAMMLVLIHHEHAHVVQCITRGVKVKQVRFNWLGGLVEAEILYANDAVPIMASGVINTGCYAFSFSAVYLAIDYIGRNLISINFANNPYINFVGSLMLFSGIMLISNCLPISYHSKKYGVITTDGWGALKFRLLRDELWNDARFEALAWQRKAQAKLNK